MKIGRESLLTKSYFLVKTWLVFENGSQFLLTLLLANHKKNAQKQEIGALKTENFFFLHQRTIIAL